MKQCIYIPSDTFRRYHTFTPSPLLKHAFVLDPYTFHSSRHGVLDKLNRFLLVITFIIASTGRCSFLPSWESHALFCEMASQVRRRYYPRESFGGTT